MLQLFTLLVEVSFELGKAVLVATYYLLVFVAIATRLDLAPLFSRDLVVEFFGRISELLFFFLKCRDCFLRDFQPLTSFSSGLGGVDLS